MIFCLATLSHYLKTKHCHICINNAILLQGMNLEITGPTLIDLKIITGTSYEVVARAASGRGFGFFIGALIGGFLVEKLDAFCDLIVGICVSLMGVFGILITYVDTTWMFVIILLQGVYEGVVNVGECLLMHIANHFDCLFFFTQNFMHHVGNSKYYYAFFLVCCSCCTFYIVSVHIQYQASIYTLPLCRGYSWRVRLAK